MSCLFCSIAQKNIPSEIVYEDDATLAFLDIHPRAPGHTLVIPKQHAENVMDADVASLQSVILTIAKVTGILHASLVPTGFTIGINQGKQAGQEIDHLHAHIIPRFGQDGGGSIQSVVSNPGAESVEQVAQRIRKKV